MAMGFIMLGLTALLIGVSIYSATKGSYTWGYGVGMAVITAYCALRLLDVVPNIF